MIKFSKFFFSFFIVEFLASGLASFLMLITLEYKESIDKVFLSFLFLNFLQIIMRNLFGNYFFSWKLMTYLYSINIAPWRIAIANILSVLFVFITLKLLFGKDSQMYDAVLAPDIGVPLFVGVVVSSVVMVQYLIKFEK